MDLDDLQPGVRVRFTASIPIQDDFDGIPVGAEGVVVNRIWYSGDDCSTPVDSGERAIQLDDSFRCLDEWGNCVMISVSELGWGSDATHSGFVLDTIVRV
jgi:hypothetical protein